MVLASGSKLESAHHKHTIKTQQKLCSWLLLLLFSEERGTFVVFFFAPHINPKGIVSVLDQSCVTSQADSWRGSKPTHNNNWKVITEHYWALPFTTKPVFHYFLFFIVEPINTMKNSTASHPSSGGRRWKMGWCWVAKVSPAYKLQLYDEIVQWIRVKKKEKTKSVLGDV